MLRAPCYGGSHERPGLEGDIVDICWDFTIMAIAREFERRAWQAKRVMKKPVLPACNTEVVGAKGGYSRSTANDRCASVAVILPQTR